LCEIKPSTLKQHALVLLLLYEKLEKGRDSFWWPMIQALPAGSQKLEGSVTEFAPHRALKLIGWGKLTFDERVVVRCLVGMRDLLELPPPERESVLNL